MIVIGDFYSCPQEFTSQEELEPEQGQATEGSGHWSAIGDINVVPAIPELLWGVSVLWREGPSNPLSPFPPLSPLSFSISLYFSPGCTSYWTSQFRLLPHG